VAQLEALHSFSYNAAIHPTIAQPENAVSPPDVGFNTQQLPNQTESHPPNYALRTASYVAGAVTLLGLALLAYEIIWVEKLSGREVLAKTFYKARLIRRQGDSHTAKGNRPPGFPPARGRIVEVVEPKGVNGP